MLAKDLWGMYGGHLVGRQIITEAVGDWPGGVATITQSMPDPAAPEIVYQVESAHGEIGIFDGEEVTLLPPTDFSKENSR